MGDAAEGRDLPEGGVVALFHGLVEGRKFSVGEVIYNMICSLKIINVIIANYV